MLIVFRYLCFFFIFSSLLISLSKAAENDYFLLDPIIISATRSQHSLSHTADHVSVYTTEDLQALPAHNLAEVLKYMPGVDIQNTGPFGQATAISIHGAASRQVLVMVDGIPFNTQLSGQANLSRIPIENIQQIDVIKGGASSVWGSSLGGVVNVITKPVGTQAKPKGRLTSNFAQFAATKNALELEGKIGDIGYSTMASFLHAEGNLADSQTREVKNFNKFKYNFNESVSLTSSFGYSGAQLRYGPTPKKPSITVTDQPYISRYGVTQLDIDHGQNQLSVAFKFNNQRVSQNSRDFTAPVFSTSTFNQDFYKGVTVNDVYEFDANRTLTTGIDAGWHKIKSSNYLRKVKSVNLQAPYANLVWKMDDWDLIPALRFDNNSQFGSQLNPSFGLVYHIPVWEGGLMRAKTAKVFNAPPILWVYNDYTSFGFHGLPNLDLKAERALVNEVGVEGPLFTSQLKGQLNLYRSDVKDALKLETNISQLTTQYRNVNKVVRQGIEGRLDYQMSQNWSLFTGANFNDSKDVQTKKIIRDSGAARTSFKWGTSYQWPCGLTFYLDGAYNRWNSNPTRANDRKPIFNGRLVENIEDVFSNVDLQIFFNVYNITNSSYWADPSYPLPGRYLEGGFSINF